jgi:hypothetical protein
MRRTGIKQQAVYKISADPGSSREIRIAAHPDLQNFPI